MRTFTWFTLSLIFMFGLGTVGAATGNRSASTGDGTKSLPKNPLEVLVDLDVPRYDMALIAQILTDKYGETGYKMSIRPFPHIILRENKMIATAGADRLQEGMRRSFGKPTGRAARIDVGQEILTIYVKEDGVETAKKACQVARTKLPMKMKIWVEKVDMDEMPAGPAEPALATTTEPITVTPVHELEEEPLAAQPSAGE